MQPTNFVDLRDDNDAQPEGIVTRSILCGAKDIYNPSSCHLIEKSKNNLVERGTLEKKASQPETIQSNNIDGDQNNLTKRLLSWTLSSSCKELGLGSVSELNEYDDAPSHTSKTFYLVHNLDLESWRHTLIWTKNRLEKGKEIGREELMCSLFYVKGYVSSAQTCHKKMSRNICVPDGEALLNMRHLICKDHNCTLGTSSVVKLINTTRSISKNCSLNNVAESTRSEKDSELLTKADYILYISSILEMESILSPLKQSNTLSTKEKLQKFQGYHPRLSVSMKSGRLWKDLHNISESVIETFRSNGTIRFEPPVCQHHSCASITLGEKKENGRRHYNKDVGKEEQEISDHLCRIDADKSIVDSTATIKFNVYDFDETYDLQVIRSLLEKELSENSNALISQSLTGRNYGIGRSIYTVCMDGKDSIKKLRRLIFDEGKSENTVNHQLAIFNVVPKLSECFITPLRKEWYQMSTDECLELVPSVKNDLEINVLTYYEDCASIGKRTIINTAEGKTTDDFSSTSSPTYHYNDGEGMRGHHLGGERLNTSLVDDASATRQPDVIHNEKQADYLINLAQKPSDVDGIKIISNEKKRGKSNKSKNTITCHSGQKSLRENTLESNTAFDTVKNSYGTAENQGGDSLCTGNEMLKSTNARALELAAGDTMRGKKLFDDKKLESNEPDEADIGINGCMPYQRIDSKDTTDNHSRDVSDNVSKFDLSPMGLSLLAPLYGIEIPPLPNIGAQLTLKFCEAQYFISQSKKCFYDKKKGRNEAENYSAPCIEELLDFLPEYARVDNLARNLYRNFVDFQDCINDYANGTYPLSRREMDIILYFLVEDIDAYQLETTLITYRCVDANDTLFESVEKLRYHLDGKYAIYMNHVKKCVGRILSMEKEELKYDLSPSALAATRPISVQNDCIPQLLTIASTLEILESSEVDKFINEAKDVFGSKKRKRHKKHEQLEKEDNTRTCSTLPLSTQSLLDFLPEFSRVNSHARNLYRNFADSPDPIVTTKRDVLRLSRREMDIILYFLSEGEDHVECHKLLPYRKDSKLERLFQRVKKSNYLTDKRYVIYIDHVKKYVEEICSLEIKQVINEERAACNSLLKYDLSPKALTYTKPIYTEGDEYGHIPSLPHSRGKLDIMNFDQVDEFITKSREIFYNKDEANFRTEKNAQESEQIISHCMEPMMNLVPDYIDVAHVCNLYRNFADSPDPLRGGDDSLYYSRREFDIILYALSIEMDSSKCHRLLLPYRDAESIERIFRVVEPNRYHEKKKYLSYMSHVKKCVERILSIERAGQTFDGTLPKIETPSPKKLASLPKKKTRKKPTVHKASMELKAGIPKRKVESPKRRRVGRPRKTV